MRAARFAFLLALAACGDDSKSTGPYDDLPLDGEFHDAALTAPVHVARDKYGVAHISGETTGDVAYVQGYVVAHDRLPQMDVLRRFGAGTLAELFGALDPSIIDSDLEMRMHRMKPLAEQSWAMLQASNDPADQELVQLLQRFTDGVNAYAGDLQAKRWDLDPNVLVSFDPSRFVEWSPVDSLVLGRFQAFALSWSTPFETEITDLYQKLRTTFDSAPMANAAAYARRGVSRDLMVILPVGTKPTVDGFPNVDTDTGSRSDGGRAMARHGTRSPGTTTAQVDAPKRPVVPQAVLDAAKKFLTKDPHGGPLGALGPHAFMYPWAGSNNWAVAPEKAGGKALLATDQHLQLPNPSIFYPTHIIIKDKVDIMGVTFPGIPGVILGTNGKLAWSATVSEHDVNDVYLEAIAPCGAQSCVTFDGQQVPIETFTDEIKIGALGTITETKTVTYERVPHHGPIIPTIANHTLVPRSGSSALSVKYTGYEPTFEIRALWNLGHAQTVDEGFAALKDFSYGSQNWTMIDNAGNIGWTTNAIVPLRDPRAYTWDPQTMPDGLAPFMVLPGDGSAEWQGRMSSRYVPHAINPAQHYLATANADPVGATFDGNALNQTVVDGRPLYAGVTYAAGVRQQRISTVLEAGNSLTLDDMATLQHDTHSNVGEALRDHIVAALDATGPADLTAYRAALSAEDQQRLATAKTLLAGWTFATPTALDSPSAQQQNDSAATVLFNAWMHFALERILKDEYDAAGFDMWALDDNFLLRVFFKLYDDPASFVQSATTSQPIVCDAYATAGPDDSCAKMTVIAVLDAMTHLESSAGFGTADTAQWKWGKLHTLTISPLFPNPALDLPASNQGFPKAGDNFVVNRSDQGWDDLTFKQYADGPAQRFLAEAAAGETIKVKWQLPGGTIYDSRSPHYRDLLDNYYIAEKHFDAPYSTAEIVGNGEARWEFKR